MNFKISQVDGLEIVLSPLPSYIVIEIVDATKNNCYFHLNRNTATITKMLEVFSLENGQDFEVEGFTLNIALFQFENKYELFVNQFFFILEESTYSKMHTFFCNIREVAA